MLKVFFPFKRYLCKCKYCKTCNICVYFLMFILTRVNLVLLLRLMSHMMTRHSSWYIMIQWYALLKCTDKLQEPFLGHIACKRFAYNFAQDWKTNTGPFKVGVMTRVWCCKVLWTQPHVLRRLCLNALHREPTLSMKRTVLEKGG